MSIIPVAWPDVPVQWHNAVVDVEPTSQYGLDRDLTSINSTLCYLNSAAEPLSVSLFAPSYAETECNVRRQSRERPVHQEAADLDRAPYQPLLDALDSGGWGSTPMRDVLDCSTRHYVADVALEPGLQVLRFHTRVPITAGPDGVYEFAMAVPMGPGALALEARLSIVVLLPNDAPEYRVEIVDWSREDAPGAEVAIHGAEGRPKFGGRAAAAWSWARGPFVWLKYRYRR